MSLVCIRYALAVPKLNASERLIFIILADRADAEGRCFPSQAYIAKRTELSIRTVKRSLQGLEEKGHLVREKRNGAHGRTSDLFILRLPDQGAKKSPTGVPNRLTIPSSPYGVEKEDRKEGARQGGAEVIAFPQPKEAARG